MTIISWQEGMPWRNGKSTPLSPKDQGFVVETAALQSKGKAAYGGHFSPDRHKARSLVGLWSLLMLSFIALQLPYLCFIVRVGNGKQMAYGLILMEWKNFGKGSLHHHDRSEGRKHRKEEEVGLNLA